MTKQVPDHYPRFIDQSIRSMEFAADVVDGVHIVKIVDMEAADPDGIWDGVAAGTASVSYTSADYKSTFSGGSGSLTSTSGMIDAAYGRVLTAKGTSGSDHVLFVRGRDYLGAAMTESITLSGTTVRHFNKAFKFVEGMTINSATTGQSGDTVDIGWSNQFGLPYKAEKILSLTEDGANMPVDEELVHYEIPTTELAAGTAIFFMAQVSGYVSRIDSVVSVAIAGASAAVITVELGASAVTGLSMSVDCAAAVGDLDSDTAAEPRNSSSRVAKYGDVEVISNGGPSSGHLNGYVTILPVIFTIGDETTATAATNDTRGVVLPYTDADGSVDFEVRYTVDLSNLHGIAQFVS